MQIDIPLKNFYTRCINNYRFGDKHHYVDAIKNTKDKYCFNPFISTECDIQIKLGGIIEEYFISNGLLFSVNSEMKIYDLPYKNERADLSIHEVNRNTLYTSLDSHKETLGVLLKLSLQTRVILIMNSKEN